MAINGDSHDLCHKLSIGFISLTSDILIKQKYDIMIDEDEINVPHSLLNFSYKLFVRKHVLQVILPNILHFYEFDIDKGESVLNVLPTYGHVRSLFSRFLDMKRVWFKALIKC